MNKKEITREYYGNLSELRKIINSMELIPNAPSDEFDKLNIKILRQLYKDVDSTKLDNIIRSELIINYGLFYNEFNSDIIVSKIINWWNSKL